MAISATKLRANIYKVLDEALETGEPIEVERNGKVLQIVPPRKRLDLSKLPPPRQIIVGDPEEIVHMDWSEYWKPGA